MTPFERDRLLDAILEGEELANLRQASLELGRTAVRRRVRRRVGLQVMCACAPLVIAVAVLFLASHRATRQELGSQSGSVNSSHPRSGKVKIINDDELFALFAGRSFALIGKPGEQQFLLLDQPSPN